MVLTGEEINKKIKGVFKPLIKKYYCGKIRYYTPYFEPMGFSSSIIRVRKLEPLSKEQLAENKERGYSWAKKEWKNLPMVRRNKDWIINLFGNSYWVQIGKPLAVRTIHLGHKSKYGSPRFEWNPSFQIWFFKWQFVIYWIPPTDEHDKYFEQVLWWLYYYEEYGSDKPDIKKAKDSWPWRDFETKESSWDDSFLINKTEK